MTPFTIFELRPKKKKNNCYNLLNCTGAAVRNDLTKFFILSDFDHFPAESPTVTSLAKLARGQIKSWGKFYLTEALQANVLNICLDFIRSTLFYKAGQASINPISEMSLLLDIMEALF